MWDLRLQISDSRLPLGPEVSICNLQSEICNRVAWLIAGLGNPGPAYAATRHNAGFRVVEALAGGAGARFHGPERTALWARGVLGGQAAVLLKPQAWMNGSGPPVAAWLAGLGLTPDHLLVVSDDLDLEVGRVKVAAGSGHGGHRGVRSIGEALGTFAFSRVRVGIGRPVGTEATEYVLAPPGPEEAVAWCAAEARAAEAVRTILADGLAAAMNRWNPWPPAGPGQTRNPKLETRNQRREESGVPQYEIIVVFDPALGDEAVDGETNQLREVVNRLRGTVVEVQKWGKKRLAYEIRRRREGHYVFLKVEGPPGVAAEVERHGRVTETVLRAMTVRTDPRTSAPPPPPRRRPAERAAETPPPADGTL